MLIEKKLIHFICDKKYNYKGLYVTKSAFLQINQIMKKNKDHKGIKIFLKKSGCLGFKYKVILIKKLFNYEIYFKKKNIFIYLDNKDLCFLDGTIIDFIKNNFHESFQFTNNKIKQFCGCKKSFNINYKKN
ncbi:iron-sulfur cluster assembly accessory protein [Enterobacteriaceae endosymbiont of Donacia versicolorea]|uniref:HesB/IscA family protein n=1 Tax=Enterobacteriaceae endosymbiont of Donacia versicolorea TaxID=2675788 RepID=UPI001448E27D|nr:iron-sulfur cluster assembly accessory protein [Enterobacteriaceae endosymbiont of Donacia versicolorea]QJC32204.1 iron-sulfur cluster assembly accessory protein [Enterobacteriaceae endosymbiont of Donacia versicolorea]